MIILEQHKKQKIQAAVFDFDGTLSTLRCGWEKVMEPMMVEYISGGNVTDEVVSMVREYIDHSTGIQTILQMKWLAEMVKKAGMEPLDPWEYKAEYNRRLMENVQKKRDLAAAGGQDQFLMKGGLEFLQELRARGVKIYAASGTDEADVQQEAAVLGIDGYFDEIAGAKPLSEDCSKEATLRRLIGEGSQGLLVVGDGPVEIRLGKEASALTLGIAGNEKERCGFDDAKIKRLTNAGAHALIDCFADKEEIFKWMEE